MKKKCFFCAHYWKSHDVELLRDVRHNEADDDVVAGAQHVPKIYPRPRTTESLMYPLDRGAPE